MRGDEVERVVGEGDRVDHQVGLDDLRLGVVAHVDAVHLIGIERVLRLEAAANVECFAHGSCSSDAETAARLRRVTGSPHGGPSRRRAGRDHRGHGGSIRSIGAAAEQRYELALIPPAYRPIAARGATYHGLCDAVTGRPGPTRIDRTTQTQGDTHEQPRILGTRGSRPVPRRPVGAARRTGRQRQRRHPEPADRAVHPRRHPDHGGGQHPRQPLSQEPTGTTPTSSAARSSTAGARWARAPRRT